MLIGKLPNITIVLCLICIFEETRLEENTLFLQGWKRWTPPKNPPKNPPSLRRNVAEKQAGWPSQRGWRRCSRIGFQAGPSSRLVPGPSKNFQGGSTIGNSFCESYKFRVFSHYKCCKASFCCWEKQTSRVWASAGTASHCKNLEAPLGGRLQRGMVLYLGHKRYFAEHGLQIRGLRFAIQGFGNVVARVVRLVHEAGGSIVAVSDVSGVVQNPKGIDIPALLEHKRLDA